LIALDKRDVERLAKHFDLTFEEARAKFTVERWGRKYSMRRKADPIFGRICRFFDTDKRRCTIYEARPALCRSYPGGRLRSSDCPGAPGPDCSSADSCSLTACVSPTA